MEKFVTFSELSEILGISPSRLYDLIKDGIFPAPLRNPSNNRPIFNAELTEACRNVVKSRVGINGHPYTPNRKRKSTSGFTTQRGRYEGLISALSGLGLTATSKQVDEALKRLPDGGQGLEQGEVVKRVFLHLRQNG